MTLQKVEARAIESADQLPVDDANLIWGIDGAGRPVSTSAPKSPFQYGTIGDGVVNDSTEYALAEAAQNSIYLPEGSTFNLASAFTAKPVYGPGSLKMGGITYAGFQLAYDPYRTSLSFSADSFYDKTGNFPAGSDDHLTVALSPGRHKSGVLNRVTAMGALQFQRAINIDRTEAIGVNSMQFTSYANRVTAIGANAAQWFGCIDPIGDAHPMYLSNGVAPGVVGWDYDGLETRNPGIGAKLAAITVTSDLDAYQTVIVGRDCLGGIKAKYTVSVGYHSLSAGSDVEGVTSVGVETFHDGVLLKYSSGFGYGAGKLWQEGQSNLLAGNDAGKTAIKGSYNTLLGPYAGSDATQLDDTVLIGLGAGNSFGAAAVSGVLSISNRNKADLISGSFTNAFVGIGGIRGDNALGSLHVVTGGVRATGAPASYSAGNRSLIVENNGQVGLTMQGVSSSIAIINAFAGSLKGFLKYDFTDDTWSIGNNNVTQMRVTPTGMGFNGATAIAKPTGVAVTVGAIHAALVSYGLIAA